MATVGNNGGITGFSIRNSDGSSIFPHSMALGSGASITTNTNLRVQDTYTDPSDSVFGLDMAIIANAVAADSAQVVRGLRGRALSGSTNAKNWTMTAGFRGAEGAVDFSAGSASPSVITGAAGFFASNPPSLGTNVSLTNFYGLYVETPTRASNNYALFAQGGISYFGGNAGFGTTSPQSALQVRDGSYGQFSDNNAGAPLAADCDSSAELGRHSIDTTNNRYYVCNGATRG